MCSCLSDNRPDVGELNMDNAKSQHTHIETFHDQQQSQMLYDEVGSYYSLIDSDEIIHDQGMQEIKQLFNDIQEEQETDQKQDILGIVQCNQVQIQFIVDYTLDDRPLYAKKVFQKEHSYEVEKNNYENITKDFSKNNSLEKLKSYSSLMAPQTQEDIKELQIKFPLGFCTLEQFAMQRREKNIKWQKEEFLYICKKLLNFIVFMQQNGWYHGDIKPANIIIVEKQGSQLKDILDIKIIDFGGAKNTYTNQSQRTISYFSSFKRVERFKQGDKDLGKFVNIHFHKFQNEQERFQTEMYTVLRTIQYLYVIQIQNEEERNFVEFNLFNLPSTSQENLQNDFQMNNLWQQIQVYQDEDRLIKLFDHMKKNLFPKDQQFQKFLNALSGDFLHEKYTSIKILQDKFLENKEIFPDNCSDYGINDKNQVVKLAVNQILKYQPILGKKRFDACPLELLFLMDSYIEDRQCKQIGQKDIFQTQMIKHVMEQFLQDNNKNLMQLYGQPGTGKTSFIRHFKSQKSNEQPEMPIISITMTKKIVQSQFIYEKLIEHFIKHRSIKDKKILVLMDACDDLMTTSKNLENEETLDTQEEQEIYVDIMKPFIDYGIQNFKIICTTRSQELPNLQNFCQKYPQNYSAIELLPYNEQQIREYIKKYVKQVKQRKQYWNNLLFFDNDQKYFDELEKNKILETAKNPLNLRIILQVLPQIKNSDDPLFNSKKTNKTLLNNNKIQQKLSEQYGEYSFFKAFIKQLFIRKLKPLPYSDLSVLLGVNADEINIDNEDQYIIKATNLLFRFNKVLAFLLFSTGRLPIKVSDFEKEVDNRLQKYLNVNPQIRQQQIGLLKQLSPIVDNNNQKQLKDLQTYSFEHKFIEEFFVMDALVEEFSSLPQKLDFKSIQSGKIPMDQILRQNAKNLLNQKQIRTNEDAQVIKLMNNYMSGNVKQSHRIFLTQIMGNKVIPSLQNKKNLKNLLHNSQIMVQVLEGEQDQDSNQEQKQTQQQQQQKSKFQMKGALQMGKNLMQKKQQGQNIKDALQEELVNMVDLKKSDIYSGDLIQTSDVAI